MIRNKHKTILFRNIFTTKDFHMHTKFFYRVFCPLISTYSGTARTGSTYRTISSVKISVGSFGKATRDRSSGLAWTKA